MLECYVKYTTAQSYKESSENMVYFVNKTLITTLTKNNTANDYMKTQHVGELAAKTRENKCNIFN